MAALRLKIIKIGTSRHSSIWEFVDKIKNTNYSKLFKITEVTEIALPDADCYGWSYSKESLESKVTINGNVDIALGFIDQPFNDNYFAHRLTDSTGIVSLFEVDSIFSDANVHEKNFLLLMIYVSIMIYYTKANVIREIHHDDTRSCLFDMCGNKEDIIHSATKPCICYECESTLRKYELPTGLIDTLKQELKRIKKPLFYRIKDWIKAHPILSLIITFLSSILINMVSSILYDAIKWFFEKH
jgi:hypothetical protein